MKKYKYSNNVNFNDNNLNIMVNKLYTSIFKLDTETLHNHSFEVYKELISRNDFNELDDIIEKYLILQDELIRRGVDIKCLK